MVRRSVVDIALKFLETRCDVGVKRVRGGRERMCNHLNKPRRLAKRLKRDLILLEVIAKGLKENVPSVVVKLAKEIANCMCYEYRNHSISADCS